MARSKKETMAYVNEYKRTHCQMVKVECNKEYDADILEWLDKQGAKATYIKKLIRSDMAKSKSNE